MSTNVTDDMIDLQMNCFGYFLNSSIILNKCGKFHLKSRIYSCSSTDNEDYSFVAFTARLQT